MSQPTCPPFIKAAPGTTSLLLFLERQILLRHCCQGHSYKRIAADLSLQPIEVRRIHARAIERLKQSILALTLNLREEGLGVDVAKIVAAMSEPASANKQKPKHTEGHREARRAA